MKHKSSCVYSAMCVPLLLIVSCGTMKNSELRTMRDRAFYLDKFDTVYQ